MNVGRVPVGRWPRRERNARLRPRYRKTLAADFPNSWSVREHPSRALTFRATGGGPGARQRREECPLPSVPEPQLRRLSHVTKVPYRA